MVEDGEGVGRVCLRLYTCKEHTSSTRIQVRSTSDVSLELRRFTAGVLPSLLPHTVGNIRPVAQSAK